MPPGISEQKSHTGSSDIASMIATSVPAALTSVPCSRNLRPCGTDLRPLQPRPPSLASRPPSLRAAFRLLSSDLVLPPPTHRGRANAQETESSRTESRIPRLQPAD